MSSFQNVDGRRLTKDEIYSFATLLLPTKRQNDIITNTIENVLADPKDRVYGTHVYVDTRRGCEEIYGQASNMTLTEKGADNNFFSMVLPQARELYGNWRIGATYHEMDIVQLPVDATILDGNNEVSLKDQVPLFWICEHGHNSGDDNRPGIDYNTMDKVFVPDGAVTLEGQEIFGPPGNKWWTCLSHSEIGGYNKDEDLLTIRPRRLQIIRTEILSDVIKKNHTLPTILERYEKTSSVEARRKKNKLFEETGHRSEKAFKALATALDEVDTLCVEAISRQMKKIEDGEFTDETVSFFQPREYIAPVMGMHTEDIWGDYESETPYGNMISTTNPVFRKMNHIIKISSRNTRVFISKKRTKGRPPESHWEYRRKKWEYCLNCMCMPEKRASDLNKELKDNSLHIFLKRATKMTDTSMNADVVRLVEKCRKFIVAEYIRFKKFWKILEGNDERKNLLIYRPHTPALKNMLREIYRNVDKTMVPDASILGVTEVEWKGEQRPGHYFWKNWAIDMRILTFRMLLLFGFLCHKNITTSSDILGETFRRFYPGASIPEGSDLHGVLQFHNFIRFSNQYYVPLNDFLKIWRGTTLASRSSHEEYNDTIDSILNVFKTDNVREWDIMEPGVPEGKKICRNLNMMKERKKEILNPSFLSILYPKYISFIKKMHYQYDLNTGQLVDMNQENVNLENVIRTLREEHVEFIETGLPSYEISKSKVYGSLAFVKTLKIGGEAIPSQLQLVVLGTSLEWKPASQVLDEPENAFSRVFQWKIHGIGDNFKLTQWLHGTKDVVRASLYRFPTDGNINWSDIVPRLTEAMRQRGSTSHAGLNGQLNEYSEELQRRNEIIKNAGMDSKTLDAYLADLQKLKKKIEDLHEKILNGDKEGRESNARLREIRKTVKSMVTKHKYSKQ